MVHTYNEPEKERKKKNSISENGFRKFSSFQEFILNMETLPSFAAAIKHVCVGWKGESFGTRKDTPYRVVVRKKLFLLLHIHIPKGRTTTKREAPGKMSPTAKQLGTEKTDRVVWRRLKESLNCFRCLC